MHTHLPSLQDLKAQAKRLRALQHQKGEALSHSQSLEQVAHQLGYRDWNTLHHAACVLPPVANLKINDTVKGKYMGQEFSGRIVRLQKADEKFTRLTIDFDQAVDVVTFDSFSGFRKRVTCIVDAAGTTPQKLSNGTAQLQLSV